MGSSTFTPATAMKIEAGARLRVARLAVQAAHGISHAAFCCAAGVKPQTLSNYETGVRWPGPLFLIRLHQRFGVTADFIYTGSLAGLPPEITKEVVKLPIRT